MRLAPFFLGGLLVACASGGSASDRTGEGTRAAVQPVADLGLRPAKGPLVFAEGQRTVSLALLLDELARLTGQEIAFDSGLRAELEKEEETLESVTSVPADEVYPFVEALLYYRGYALTLLKEGEPTLLGVVGRGRPPSVPWATGNTHVALVTTDFSGLRRHPALVVQFTLQFENLDSRQMQTQLRQLLVDPTGLCSIVPAGERALILQGPGAKLGGLVQLLREIDAVSAARLAPQTQAEQAASPR